MSKLNVDNIRVFILKKKKLCKLLLPSVDRSSETKFEQLNVGNIGRVGGVGSVGRWEGNFVLINSDTLL
jgi:hypothetical protein